MPTSPKPAVPSPETADERLDEALEETFPASDPIAVHDDPSSDDAQPEPPATPPGKNHRPTH